MQLKSDFSHPSLIPSVTLLRDHFSSSVAKEMRPLRNPHHEPKVSEQVKEGARPAAVLIPIISRQGELTLLVTHRHRNIRFAGHICFPGGGCEDGDESMEHAALREAEEEINLTSDRVEVMGRLGDYYTQTGYRISPFVGLVTPPLGLKAHPDEVEQFRGGKVKLKGFFVGQVMREMRGQGNPKLVNQRLSALLEGPG